MAGQGVGEFFAHSENDGGRREPIAEHVRAVAERAAAFASAFGAADQARATGLLHDLGKYSERFLRRVTGQSRSPAGDHGLAGAYVTLHRYKQKGCLPAAAILGHHGGLRRGEWNWCKWAHDLDKEIRHHPDRVTDARVQRLLDRLRADGFELPDISAGLTPSDDHHCDDMVDTRMLFSSLVDADFLETEAHFDGDARQPRRYRQPGPTLDPAAALAAVDAHVRSLDGGEPGIQAVRDRLRRTCLDAAESPPGLFTLSAPTGSGKTLAMLSFALRHAARHNLRRVVLVMPFLNIIDQTAAIYRELFSGAAGFADHYVLEDHSLADLPGEQDNREETSRQKVRRLLAENWDAPIVLVRRQRQWQSRGLESSHGFGC